VVAGVAAIGLTVWLNDLAGDGRRPLAGWHDWRLPEPRGRPPTPPSLSTLQGRRAFTDEREARLASFRWLHRYDTTRRHSRLGQQSPNTYERTRATPATLAAAA
jgi:transposase InsO family protein